MSKYTSGKWEARPNRIIANGHVLAILNGGNAANERLIAAAPEMYELLEVWVNIQAQPTLKEARKRASELLARIDGEERN